MPLLNDASALRLGSLTVDKAFMGTTQVWPPEDQPEFYPDELAGLALWYKADWTEYYVGQPVNFNWTDISGNEKDLVLVGTPPPTFQEKDGYPVIRFTTSEGRFRHASTGVTTEWTLVYVARLIGPTPGRVVDATYPPSNLLVGFWNGYQDVMYDNGFTSPNTQTAWTTDWKLYSGDGTAGLSRLFSDGVLLGSTTTSAGWGGSFNISGYGSTGVEETCDCEVAEIVMYNRKLSDVERGQVEEYLRVKWEV
jgi:hypothetical protein